MNQPKEDDVALEKLCGRQARPNSSSVYRIKLKGGQYYFGVVVDSKFDGPMGPGAILTVIFAQASNDGVFRQAHELGDQPYLLPPQILNQRLWTRGYAEKLDSRCILDSSSFVFWQPALGRHVDVAGNPIEKPIDNKCVGEWSVGNEFTLSDEILHVVTEVA